MPTQSTTFTAHPRSADRATRTSASRSSSRGRAATTSARSTERRCATNRSRNATKNSASSCACAISPRTIDPVFFKRAKVARKNRVALKDYHIWPPKSLTCVYAMRSSGLCSSPSRHCFLARHYFKALPSRKRLRPLQRLSVLLVGSRPRDSSTRRPARRWFRRIWARSSSRASPKARSRSSLRTRRRSRSGRLEVSRRRRRRRCRRIARLLCITRFRFRSCHRESRTASYLRRTAAARAPLSKAPARSDRSALKLSIASVPCVSGFVSRRAGTRGASRMSTCSFHWGSRPA